MNKFSTLRRALLAPAMLFLCGFFLQSCTEEMPILSPNDLSGTASTKSTVVLNVKNTNATYTINDSKPSTIIFATTGTDPQFPMYKQFGFEATNNSQTNPLDYAVSFHTDTVGSKNYTFELSTVTINKKTYASANINGDVIFKVDKLDATNNTATGSFAYYVFDDILTPKDSIYISGTFNIVK